MRSTHTYSLLELSRPAYDEIRKRLEDAGYSHAFDGDVIDMHGLAVTPEPKASAPFTPQPGDIVRLRWDPTTEKLARFVRYAGPKSALLEVQRVDRKKQPVPGLWGAPRSFPRTDILGLGLLG